MVGTVVSKSSPWRMWQLHWRSGLPRVVNSRWMHWARAGSRNMSVGFTLSCRVARPCYSYLHSSEMPV